MIPYYRVQNNLPAVLPQPLLLHTEEAVHLQISNEQVIG